MAKIKFNRGTKTKINSSAISDGSLNLATDDGTLYADVSSTKRIELNPQSDWNTTDTSSKGYIKNKPDLSKYETVSSATSYYSILQSNIDTKQDKLTFDTTPTANSSNPVTSDGIKAAIDAKTVDLSNYYTKTQVDNAITNAIASITDGDNKSY